MRMLLIALCSVAAIVPVAASAQSNIEGRVGRLESEMRAVQRKVFPGGAVPVIQPEVTGPAPGPSVAPGAPATSAVADLTARVGSLEGQMAQLTGQIEQNQYRLRLLQEAFDTYRRTTDARLGALASAPAATAGDYSPATEPAEPAPRPARGGRPRPPVADGDAAPSASTPAKPATAARGETASVDRPSTGDAAEDDYLYGYRLWAAKKYPEAEAQLKKVVADHPKSRRASYAQNLLGRSYLDEGKPSLASMAFYDNYKKMPEGERAPESLYYLGQALMKLNKPSDACKVYGELTDVYGDKVSAGMKADVARARTAAKCQ